MRLTVNGQLQEVDARTDEMLLAVLRRAGLTSVRESCGIGVCGSCTVLVDDEPISGCLMLAKAVEGQEVTTVEGLGGDHPLQRAFSEVRAFQCGYCAPGFVLAAKRLLEETSSPADAEIRVALAGNLCRCGSYLKILEAVRTAAG
jgi:aerobic-type carbon monoxide dehydrogenase small subunit (CoxS/CutS family)